MLTWAMVFPEPNKVALAEVQLPALEADDVLIRTECSFVSTGTERWTWEGKMGLRGGGFAFPIVPGYQKVGWVEDVGADVTRFVRGQRVFMTTGRVEDATSCWGGHMQYAVQRESEVYELPEALSSEGAAALVIVQVGWNTGHRPQVQPGEVAVVIGDGVIGQFTAMALRSRGAYVWLAGHHDARLALALGRSADGTINTLEHDLSEAVLAAHPGGVDVVVETVCHPEDTPQYVRMLPRWGQLVIAAYHPDTNWVDLAPVQDKEITVHSTGGWTRERMEATITDMVGGKLEVEPLITHRVPWRDAPGAYERLVRDREEDSLGIVIDWR
jgi:2-desacetyl-2-hydroxyethyl bacteriochlorophyllide A dehydrogenase